MSTSVRQPAEYCYKGLHYRWEKMLEKFASKRAGQAPHKKLTGSQLHKDCSFCIYALGTEQSVAFAKQKVRLVLCAEQREHGNLGSEMDSVINVRHQG